MITTYSTLDRTSSYLILQLTDLRINARLFGHNAMSQLETDLLDIADEACHEGRRLGVNKLVMAGLGGCVSPLLHTSGRQLGCAEAVVMAAQLFNQLINALSSQFEIEIFGVTGTVQSFTGEVAIRASNAMRYIDGLVYCSLARYLRGEPGIVFRGLEEEAMLLNAGESSFIWSYRYDPESPRDLPIQSSLTLAEPDHSDHHGCCVVTLLAHRI
jgi:hypothetical protein